MQIGENLPYPTVADDIEIIRFEHLGNVVIGLRVDKHRSEYRLFRLAVVGLGLDCSGSKIFGFYEIFHLFSGFIMF